MKKIKLAVIAALFALVTVSNSNAQDENNPWAIGFGINIVDFYQPGASFVDNLGDHLGSSDWNFLPSISRITAEKYLDKGFSLQLAGSLNKIDYVLTENDADFLFWNVGLNVKYDVNKLIGETGWFDPFVGLGGTYVSADDMSEGMLTTSAGFNVWFNDNLGMNFTTASNFGFADKVRDHIQSSLGLVVKFGGKDTDGDGIYDKNDACPEVAGLAEFNGCPDADGDGIKDSDDACPNLAGLTAMNGCPDSDGDGVADKDDMCPNDKGTKANNGCPDSDGDGVADKDDMCPNEKGTKANKGCPDTDGDGVLDKDDKCSTTAGPAANNGCPWPDTDGDGVLDKDDKCLNEVGPASNNGCPEEELVMSEEQITMLANYSKGINFAVDQAKINKESADKLDSIYDLIGSIKDVTFVIEGHADSTGDAGYNKYLSERRAESAKAYLVKKGMDSSKLETKGFGEKDPIADNSTVQGRSKNRRVVIKLNDM